MLFLFLILTTLSWDFRKSASAFPIIVEATRPIELFAVGSMRPQLVGKNRQLRPDDRLKIPPRVTVRIACDNGDVRPVTPGRISSIKEICPQRSRRSSRRPVFRPRPANRDLPYIISPRATFLLSNKPTLRWNGATGASRFSVTIRGKDLDWTQEFSQEKVCQKGICEVPYPGNSPLQPGVWYKLIIEADTNRSSAEDTTKGLGFKLIDTEAAAEIKAIKQGLAEEDISEETKTLFLASRYEEYNLKAEAIEMLEALPQEKKIAQIYRWLGDLYQQTGLILEAEVQYLQAVNLAEGSENLAELAAAKMGLAEVKYTRSQREEGIRLLAEAKRIYEQLGEIQIVQDLNQRLEEWKR